MEQLLETLTLGATPFCMIQKQDSEDILLLTGEAARYRAIGDIPRKKAETKGRCIYDTISVVPFCQIRERGYSVRDGGEHILTIKIDSQQEVDVKSLLTILPSEEIRLQEAMTYDMDEEEYRSVIQDIVTLEIGNGEGANFVVPRNAEGVIDEFTVSKGLTIFKALLQSDYGTYWKFIFYDTERFFIGSTPERHLYVKGGQVKMNPISGTFRKGAGRTRRKEFKRDLLGFLSNRKEINELFMVVDEELKMMAKMCDRGGEIIGPVLKEMSRLIHSEYLLCGESDKDIFELFIDSMFAATVVGSPVENACNVLAKYSDSSRRYYGSAMMLVGRDEAGADFLDSPITIRTVEIEPEGKLYFSVGATLVKDSIPAEEVQETVAKGGAVLSCIETNNSIRVAEPMLPGLMNDDEVIETLVHRNRNLSGFWFFRQNQAGFLPFKEQSVSISIIHNEDDFAYMLRHMLNCMGFSTTVVRFNEYDFEQDNSHITILGPGPGNPNDQDSEKIVINHQIARGLLKRKKKALFICLGHQILCNTLGFEVKRKAFPLQGSQARINLFGREELVGFYNTFAAAAGKNAAVLETATGPELNELAAVRGEHFVGYQFHPESLLTQNGYSILLETIGYLLSDHPVCQSLR